MVYESAKADEFNKVSNATIPKTAIRFFFILAIPPYFFLILVK